MSAFVAASFDYVSPAGGLHASTESVDLTYLSFLDYLIYMPILVHFFIKMQETNNFLPLSFIIYFMILTCFSLGSFSLLYLFIIFGAYVFIVSEKEDRASLITKTILALVVGVSFALPILIPSFFSYLSSGRSEVLSITSDLSSSTTSRCTRPRHARNLRSLP